MSFSFSDFQTLLSNLASAASQVASSGTIGGKKDQEHTAQVGAILSLLSFVLNFHPQSPTSTTVQAADGANITTPTVGKDGGG